MKDFRYFALLACVLTLPACQTMEGIADDLSSLNFPSMSLTESNADSLIYDGNCPKVEVVDDLNTFTDFTDSTEPSEFNLISRAHINNINAACAYQENTVTVDLTIDFNGILGPRGANAGGKTSYSYPFFVAVTNPSGDILAKEVFGVSMNYEPGVTTKTAKDKMRQVIPVDSRDKGSRHKVLIGFQLNPEQLAYNRDLNKKMRLLDDAQAQKPTVYRMQAEDAMNNAEREVVNRGNPIDITGQ